MNRFLAKVDFERASVPMNKRVRILYMTQAAVSPPTFILFTDRAVKLHFAYQRFLENQIREAFGFVGSPIWIKNPRTQRCQSKIAAIDLQLQKKPSPAPPTGVTFIGSNLQRPARTGCRSRFLPASSVITTRKLTAGPNNSSIFLHASIESTG